MNVLYEEDKFPKGKYQGKTVKEVAEIDPAYLHWIQSSGKNLAISDEVMENLHRYRQTKSQTTGHRLEGDTRLA